MTLINGNLHGVILTELRQIVDERGAVLHLLRNDAPDFVRFGECYCSEIVPHAIKAWKRHQLQTQNLAVPVGRIRMVIFDDREESPTRGQLQIVELGRPEAYFRLQIPPMLWYGFSGISDTTALLVNCTDYPHSSTESELRSIDSLDIPYQW